MLQKNGIAFEEFSLDDKANADEMLKRIKAAGYKGQIHLPVIFENDSTLLHPQSPHNDSTLYFLIQKIISEKQSYTSGSTKTETVSQQNEKDGDCVVDIEN